MEQSKTREATLLNFVLAGMAVLALGVGAWDLATSDFRGGTDDLFTLFVCLLLAVVFAINPLIWAHSKGWIGNPFTAVDEEVEGAVALDEHGGGSNRENTIVWGGLLGLTGIEVFLAYIHINLTLMLIILMGLSIIKAALIVAYFMHLKFERLSLILTIVPILVVLLCLFSIFFPDSERINKLRSHQFTQSEQVK